MNKLTKAKMGLCWCCGDAQPYELLDAKPLTWSFWEQLLVRFGNQRQALSRASSRGADFVRLECSRCYGPGYQALQKDQ